MTTQYNPTNASQVLYFVSSGEHTLWQCWWFCYVSWSMLEYLRNLMKMVNTMLRGKRFCLPLAGWGIEDKLHTCPNFSFWQMSGVVTYIPSKTLETYQTEYKYKSSVQQQLGAFRALGRWLVWNSNTILLLRSKGPWFVGSITVLSRQAARALEVALCARRPGVQK